MTSVFANDPDMQELVQMFVTELPERVATLTGAWREGDLVEVRRVAHQLKGASGGYGFPALGESAGELESTATRALTSRAEADLEGVRQRLDELIQLCNRVRSA